MVKKPRLDSVLRPDLEKLSDDIFLAALLLWFHGRIAKEVKAASEAAAPLKVLRGGTRMLCRRLAFMRKECALESKMV